MNSYKARISSISKQFDGMEILLSSRAEIQKNTSLKWLEPLKEEANEEEKKWYERAKKLVVSGY